MGLDDRPQKSPTFVPHSPQKSSKQPPPVKRSSVPKDTKYLTTEQKKSAKTKNDVEKYATAPAPDRSAANLDKKILVSLISQSEYMKRHLYIKTGVDHDRPVLRYQLKKVSIRNYTPKAINQDINMGMWI